jgi:hypothetical protein
MESEADPILDSAYELRVRGKGWRSEVPRPRFAVDREQAPERQLESTAVTPRANGVGKPDWLRTALHPDSTEGVRHETLTQSGVHRTQHKIRIGGPDEIRGALSETVLGG